MSNPKSEPPQMQPNPEQSALSMRLRLVEEKSNNLNKKIEFLERNMVAANKKKNEMLHNFDADILEIKRDIDALKQKTDLIIRELKLSAGKDELNTIKRYLDLWNLARFVTREEVERIVEEAMQARHPVAQTVQKTQEAVEQ